jgi:RimJ/RimL family protein N-acetyltransferase
MPRTAAANPDLDHQLIELRGGPTVVVRPITTADGPALRSYLEGLSRQSRYMRFMQPMPRVSGRLIDMFTGGERRQSLVLIALLDGEVVAEAMLVIDRSDDTTAEIAYSVADRLHRRGLGRSLVELLVEAAGRRGVRRLRADVLGENMASVALLRSFGARLRFEDGVLVADLHLADLHPADLHPADVPSTRLSRRNTLLVVERENLGAMS